MGRMSSPCMWGCFCKALWNIDDIPVFPMHVGVFLRLHDGAERRCRLPHACGGVSTHLSVIETLNESSPCMWGCFYRRDCARLGGAVFPMHVGVFLIRSETACSLFRLPHACGGVSLASGNVLTPLRVFPMHVGVFLNVLPFWVEHDGLPHACGGVSNPIKHSYSVNQSSPCMWGCFLIRLYIGTKESVFPMHVGVFLSTENRFRIALSLPHACGGVSVLDNTPCGPVESSPCMWGCFLRKALIS